jgi:Fic family protein
MLTIRRTFAEPLTKEMLFEWHQMVIKNDDWTKSGMVGAWRNNKEAMQIVSGPIGRERIYFEAPPSNRLASEMEAFINWFNETQSKEGFVNDKGLSGPVRAAIAHLYFESIHPFIDGNGRIGRALIEKILSQELGSPLLFSVSQIIQKRRKEYYNMLHLNSHNSLDITQWICFFVELIFEAQRSSQEMLQFVLKKTHFWRTHEHQITERQEKALQRMFKEGPTGFEGGMSAQKYMNITGCSKATATRDLTDLLEKKCLYQMNGSGRSTRYQLVLKEREQHGC